MRGRYHIGILLILTVILAACGGDGAESAVEVGPTLTPVPSSTNTLTAMPTNTLMPTITFTPSRTPVPMELIPAEGDVPPITIDLPEDWRTQYYALPIQDVDGSLRPLQIAAYDGPVTGGTGFIVLIWGFPNVNVMDSLTNTRRETLWLDGLRFWRLQINEIDCNIGSDLQRDFMVGGLPAVGTFISAINCPNDPDTAGWFAGLESEGMNFLFYAFTDPREAIEVDGAAPAELQGLLNTVQFRVQDWIAETSLTATARANVEVTAEVTPEATPTAESGD